MPQIETPTWDDTEALPSWDDTIPDLETLSRNTLKFGQPSGLETTKELTTALASSAARAAEPVTRFAFTPLVNPQPSPADIEFRKRNPRIGGVEEGVVNLAKGFTSPIGIATLGLGALPAKLARPIALAFAAQMTASVPELATQLGTEFGKPAGRKDEKEIARLLTEAAGTAAFTTLAAKHGLSPTRTSVSGLAKEIEAAPFTPGISPDQAAQVRAGLPPRPTAPAVPPELLRTKELVDRAIQEAQGTTIVIPGQTPAIDLLKAQGVEITPTTIALAERIQGGGEAPYGKTTFMREAEAPTTERTQSALASTPQTDAAASSQVQKGGTEAAAEPIKTTLPPPVIPDYDPGDVGKRAIIQRKKDSGMAHDQAVAEASKETDSVRNWITENTGAGDVVQDKSGRLYFNDNGEWVALDQNGISTRPVTDLSQLRGGKIIRRGLKSKEADALKTKFVKTQLEGVERYDFNDEAATAVANLGGDMESKSATDKARNAENTRKQEAELAAYLAEQGVEVPKPTTNPELKSEELVVPTSVPEPVKPAAKEPWQMTRAEYTKHEGGEVPPIETQALDAISNQNNRKPYNPDLITPDAVAFLKKNGLIKGTKNFTLTSTGIDALYTQRRLNKEADLKRGDAWDNHPDLVEKSVKEGKPVPPEVLKDYPDLAKPTPTAPPTETGKGKELTQVERKKYTELYRLESELAMGKSRIYVPDDSLITAGDQAYQNLKSGLEQKATKAGYVKTSNATRTFWEIPAKAKEVFGGGEVMGQSEWNDVHGEKTPGRPMGSGIRLRPGTAIPVDTKRSQSMRIKKINEVSKRNQDAWVEYVRKELEAGKPIRNEWLRSWASLVGEPALPFLEKYGYNIKERPIRSDFETDATLRPRTRVGMEAESKTPEEKPTPETAAGKEGAKTIFYATSPATGPVQVIRDFVKSPNTWEVRTPNGKTFEVESYRMRRVFGDEEASLSKAFESQKLTETKGALDTAIKNIEDLQKRLESGFHKGDTALGIPVAILNAALDVAKLTLKAGKSVAEAVDAAIEHIRKHATFEVKSKFDEAKTREQLNGMLAGFPANVKSAVTQAKSAAPTGPETLDDVYKIFEPPKKKPLKIGQAVSQTAEAVRTGLASKFRPIDKLAEDIAKEYGVATPKGIAGIFEAIKGSSGKAEADVYRFDREVSRPLRGMEKDFNAYVFLRRSLDRLREDYEDLMKAARGEPVKKLNRRSVSEYTIPQLESKLKLLEDRLGPERIALFDKAAEAYQKHLDAALKLQVDSGRMSAEVYQAIKDGNQFYAPFKVMKYLQESSLPEGSGRRIDTLADYTKAMEGIHDKDFRLGDMLAAARQNIMLSRILAEKNRAMTQLASLAGYDVDGRFIRKLKAMQEVPHGMEAVNVLENGTKEKYVVNKDVAEAVQIYGQESQNIIVKMLGAFALPFRVGATSLNIPFQVSNLLADQPRAALISKYGIRGATDLIRYPLDFGNAVITSILGDVVGYKNKLFLDFLDSGVAGSTIQETLTPKALHPETFSRAKTIGRGILWAIPDFAKAIEQTSKIMGVKRAMRFEGVESGKELATKIPQAVTELRRFSGSPDFGRQGKWVEQARLNILYMFFNARLQGATADIGRLTGRDGVGAATKTWAKLGVAVGIPSVFAYLLNRDEKYSDDYDKRPKQEKQNYWLIPKDTFITGPNGEKIRDYWRIPKRESAKWIANMTEAALEFARNQDPEHFGRFAQGMMEDISPVNIQGNTAQERMESTLTSLNPLIKAPMEMAMNRDTYRHKPIVPDPMKKASPELQYTDRTSEVFKTLANKMPDIAPEVFRSPLQLEQLTRNLTAGLLTQFLPRKPVEGRTGFENAALLQRFQAIPVVEREAFDKQLNSLQRESADEALTRDRNVRKLMEDNKGKDLKELAKIAVQKYGKDVKLVNHLVDLTIAEQRGITGEERSLLALPAQQRAEYIANQIKGKDAAKRQEMLRNFASKRILTEAVAAELAPLLK